ncbi:hypothetical protein EMCG_04742 [[Emmonsia] crescens]|uniref:Uncharacterized protein n=1 Tax=[Emmonsia] crescens TaxID=73230 RepID=A0A0G2HS83_9EURO|nr:hypothetical protein EMCG_04742 [Emmonsia crescens UAMH 3008]
MFPKKAGKEASNELMTKFRDVESFVDSLQEITDCIRFLKLPGTQKTLQGMTAVIAPELERHDKIKELENMLETFTAMKNTQIKKMEEDKEQIIQKLEAENKKLKEAGRAVSQEKESVAKEKSELERERQEDKKKYREKEAKLEKTKKEALEKERKKLKEEYQEKEKTAQNNVKAQMKKLEKEKADSNKLNDDLTIDVDRLKVYRDSMEKMNKELKKDVSKLQEKLRTLSAETAVSRTPSIDYKKQVEHMYQLIGGFATRSFENLPREVQLILEPLGSKYNLGKASPIFNYTSCSSSRVAIALRKAAVQNFISGQLISIFQNKLLVSCGTHEQEAILNIISATLSLDDEKVWRGITINALDKRPEFSDITKLIEQVAQQTVDTLQPLLDNNEQEKAAVQGEVAEIFKAVLKLWLLRRKDSCTITINSTPGLKNDGSWVALVLEEDSAPPPFSFPSNGVNGVNGNGISDEPESLASTTLLSPKLHPRAESYVIFPQIIGEFDTDDKDNERGSPKIRESMILHPGIALFSDSPMFDIGLRDIETLKNEFLNVHHRRRMSSLSSPTNRANRSLDKAWLTKPSGEPAVED